MKLHVTNSALACFRSEWDFREGDEIRIYIRYSGGGADAFAFGITKDSPQSPALSADRNGIVFYMEKDDVWYLEGGELTVDCRDGQIVFDRSDGETGR